MQEESAEGMVLRYETMLTAHIMEGSQSWNDKL